MLAPPAHADRHRTVEDVARCSECVEYVFTLIRKHPPREQEKAGRVTERDDGRSHPA